MKNCLFLLAVIFTFSLQEIHGMWRDQNSKEALRRKITSKHRVKTLEQPFKEDFQYVSGMQEGLEGTCSMGVKGLNGITQLPIAYTNGQVTSHDLEHALINNINGVEDVQFINEDHPKKPRKFFPLEGTLCSINVHGLKGISTFDNVQYKDGRFTLNDLQLALRARCPFEDLEDVLFVAGDIRITTERPMSIEDFQRYGAFHIIKK